MPKPASAAAVSSGHVLQLVRDGRAATRADIGRLTGLSRPAVALRVGELMRQGLVTEGEAAPSSGGRPPGRLEFNAAGGVVLAATLGISTSQIAVCDLAGRVLVQDSGSPDVEHGPHAALPWLLDTWADLLAKCGRGPGDVRGTGIGVPGTVEFATGRAETPPVLASWGGIEIRPLVAERFEAPVLLDNDVNVMALGAHRTHHRDVGDLVFVKVSTGIGAGIVAGGHALLAAMERAGRPLGGLAELAALAQEGDAAAVTLVRGAGRRLGEVLAGAVNLLNPEVVVLGGLLGGAYDHLVAGVREIVFQRSTALATRQLRIVPNTAGDEAGLRGAAAMVLDRVLAPEAVNAAIAAAREGGGA
ncbi:ROK family protein [Streptomonospora nanhaiensis]|uniref:ROK family transcriptional regulator n=1 Tax=Streptomonospora nanhaiensis TaxID=1323731 RepID=UPI00361C5DE7